MVYVDKKLQFLDIAYIISYPSFTDEEAKQETLAIRFANADNAKKFKDAFDNAVLKVTETEADRIEGKDEVAEKPKSKDDDPSEKMTQLTIKEETSK